MPRKVTFDNINHIMVDKLITDNNENLVFISAVGYKSSVDKLIDSINGKQSCYIRFKNNNNWNRTASVHSKANAFECIQKKMGKNDYVHVICYKKPIVNDDSFFMFLFRDKNNDAEEMEFLQDKVYELLENYLLYHA